MIHELACPFSRPKPNSESQCQCLGCHCPDGTPVRGGGECTRCKRKPIQLMVKS